MINHQKISFGSVPGLRRISSNSVLFGNGLQFRDSFEPSSQASIFASEFSRHKGSVGLNEENV